MPKHALVRILTLIILPTNVSWLNLGCHSAQIGSPLTSSLISYAYLLESFSIVWVIAWHSHRMLRFIIIIIDCVEWNFDSRLYGEFNIIWPIQILLGCFGNAIGLFKCTVLLFKYLCFDFWRVNIFLILLLISYIIRIQVILHPVRVTAIHLIARASCQIHVAYWRRVKTSNLVHGILLVELVLLLTTGKRILLHGLRRLHLWQLPLRLKNIETRLCVHSGLARDGTLARPLRREEPSSAIFALTRRWTEFH
jgi:hypothetical protein